MRKSKSPKASSPFETRELRAALERFLKLPLQSWGLGKQAQVGACKWAVYIFFDYDGEPIYVGQTSERVSTRVRRHLTNQRTDAVAMSVLDPFEVAAIEVFPLPEYQFVTKKHEGYKAAKAHLDALEYLVHFKAINESRFKAILNEKNPPKPDKEHPLPESVKGTIVTDQVRELRGHEDTRAARRAQIISRLAQTIAEREVKVGLRRTLIVQADRLRWLANTRFKQLGGEGAVETSAEDDEEENK